MEFALVLPVFLLMLFALLDGGRYIYMTSVLSQAAREGARLAAVEASWIASTDPSCNRSGGPVCPATTAALKTDTLGAANRMVTPFGVIKPSQILVQCNAPGAAPDHVTGAPACTVNTGASNNLVSVRVELTFRPILPLMPDITASGSATMVIN